eukprot:scaffold236538_cov15-Prasinocladus_malaysianus.AAC.1
MALPKNGRPTFEHSTQPMVLGTPRPIGCCQIFQAYDFNLLSIKMGQPGLIPQMSQTNGSRQLMERATRSKAKQ